MRHLMAFLFVGFALSSCSGSENRPLTLVAYDSFVMSEDAQASFEEASGMELEILTVGDAGQLLSQLTITAGDPIADVVWGIDNTRLTSGLEVDLFSTYRPAGIDSLDPSLLSDPDGRVTPVNRGDVCINYDREWFDRAGIAPPLKLDDLTDPIYRDLLVVQHPEQSSPGLAFLLATVATYGESGWVEYWDQLRANGVLVVSGWTEAYQGEFTRSGGDRPLVVSYASSPPVDVLFSSAPIKEAPTGVMQESCFAVVEFAAILNGTSNPEGAGMLVDFLISEEFQAEIPLSMFVYPANTNVELPEVFREHSEIPNNSLSISAADIDEHRDKWTEQWVETVLR